MGGPGSGRRPSSASRRRVEDSLALTISALARNGLLWAGKDATTILRWMQADNTAAASANVTVEVDENRQPRLVQLLYAVESDGILVNVRQRIPLTATGLPRGGHRWWFACPACGRRRGVLVLPAGERVFACRRCYRLLYASQMGPGRGRAME